MRHEQMQPSEKEPRRVMPVVFTDADATLLDHESYDFTAALPAIDRMKTHQIPLVVTSSKTVDELDALYGELGIHSPAIYENGGGIVLPDGYITTDISHLLDDANAKTERHKNATLITLGKPIDEVRNALLHASASTGVHVEGFGDWVTTPEVMTRHCKFMSDHHGTALQKAERSLARRSQEGFVITDAGAYAHEQDAAIALKHAIEDQGFMYSVGGRFHQIFGNSDKGTAVSLLSTILATEFNTTMYPVGLGDAQNDVAMLDTCIALGGEGFLLHNPHAKSKVNLPISSTIVRVPPYYPGPTGWNAAVSNLLDRHGYTD